LRRDDIEDRITRITDARFFNFKVEDPDNAKDFIGMQVDKAPHDRLSCVRGAVGQAHIGSRKSLVPDHGATPWLILKLQYAA
jgi:hypothetical protein